MQVLANSELDDDVLDWVVHMDRAVELAEHVLTARPNPRVGCVLVRDSQVVGEGWHKAAGLPHAEVMALEAAGGEAEGATAFVTLEPCDHIGRTGPCTEALIAGGISRVVIAAGDPNPAVAGSGIERLEAAGIEAFQLKDFARRARALNAGFFKRHSDGLPFVRCKLAMSLDGRTALANGDSQWITGAAARRDVQRLRAASSAIITGVDTVLADDPSMTVREAELPLSEIELQRNLDALSEPPLRVIVDSKLRTPGTARILQGPGPVKIYCVEGATAPDTLANHVEIVPTQGRHDRVALESVLKSLAENFECNEVLVEAGPTLSGAFLSAGLVDELILYIAPKLLGSDAMPLVNLQGLQLLADAPQLAVTDVAQVGDDIRVIAEPRG